MNWRHIWELTKINLLYSNPQALTKVRKQQAKHPGQPSKPAYRSVMRQQLFAILLYSFLFIYLFSAIDYRTHPGYFSFQLFMFFLMSVTSAFSTMFAVFYNSHDTKLYLPLPVTEREIYMAKLLASIGLNLTFLMPTFSLFVIAYSQLVGNPLVATILALIQFILLALLSISVSTFLVHALGSVLMRFRQKNMISTGLMLVSSIGAVGLLLFMQHTTLNATDVSGQLPDFPIIPIMVGFYQIVQSPLALNSLLQYGLVLLLTVGACALVLTRVIPQYYRQLAAIDSKKATVRKSKQNANIQQTMIRHHLGTLKDPTLIMTNFMASFMILCFIAPNLLNGGMDFYQLPLAFWGLTFIAGSGLGFLTTGSFTMVGMSLEREQFYFLKSLPIDFQHFLKQKFWVLWAAQTLIPFLLACGICFITHLPFLHGLSFLAGLLTTSYISSLAFYKHDYKHLTLQWQNVSQLFSRGGGQLMKMVLLLVSLVAYAAILFGLYFLSTLTHAGLVSSLTVIAILVLIVILHFHYKKTFWSRFN